MTLPGSPRNLAIPQLPRSGDWTIVRPMIIAHIVNQTTNSVAQTGIGLGSAIAVVCSWQRNRSILWAILAGILSWFYVIYFAVTREADETK